MKRHFRLPLFLALLVGSTLAASAQSVLLPLFFRQDLIGYNLQSVRGVPISTNVNPGIGSDGRMTNFNETIDPGGTRSTLLPTAKQYQSLVAFGGTPALTTANWLAVSNSAILKAGTTPFSPTVAAEMRLPVGQSNAAIVVVLRRAQIGVPYLSRQVSFDFGSVVQVPVTDENGLPLTTVSPTAYWLPEPHTLNNHSNAGYYWSPHAGKVYAIQSGPLTIKWKKAAYTTTPPPDYASNPQNYYVNAGAYFRLYSVNYVVSGSAVKPTRKMYWTERGFRREGKPVVVPTSRVASLNIVYNESGFPRTVAEEYVGPGDSDPTDGTTNSPLPELRTLWYDQQQGALYAYNQEGRVFMELLGDLRPDGQTRQQLGFEIVDVYKSPAPIDVNIDLGDRITPPAPGSLDDLSPEPVLQPAATPFAYQNTVPGSDVIQLYAIRETFNQNDYFVHWMETGEVGLKWPLLYGRYRLAWPTDVSKYSHYVRPLVATETEAMVTAVPMPTDNVPTIQYQDPLDTPRAKFTPTFGFYTFLSPAYPAHRTLLLFNAGDNIAFERVFSWLDTNLKAANFADTLATNLTTVANHYNRGVNGEWNLFVSDGFPQQDGGTIGSWGLVVETTNAVTGTLTTREFTNSGTIHIDLNVAARPYPSTVTVEGIAEEVTAIRVKLNGYSHTWPVDVDVFLLAPGGNVCALMSDAGGVGPGVANVNLVFDDAAASLIPQTTPPTSGSYRPANYITYTDLLPPGNPVATLDQLLSPRPGTQPIPWADELAAPRVVEESVAVGDRINAPAGEPGAEGGAAYLAGHIHQPAGISFNPHAYLDPFTAGFELANRGAVIAVNAIPGTNKLEVWWFRTNHADLTRGFKPVYWPSVIGRYTLQWPASPREIVLASNKGSEGNGPLNSFEAKGVIYHQNTPGLPGYNPNEEHAIMSGGTVFATRDDLNITSASGYSSAPFALIEYPDADGRPSMSAFKVMREKPEAGWVFDYIVEAGRLLQAPMPLPLLAKPLEGTGDDIINYNTEPTALAGDLPGGWDPVRDPEGPFAHYQRFTYRDRKNDFWVYRGLHTGLPELRAGTYVATNNSFAALANATAIVGEPFQFVVHASRQDEFLALTTSANLPGWLSVSGLSLIGTPASNQVGTTTVQLVVRDLYQGESATNNLTITVLASGAMLTQGTLILSSTNDYTGSIVNFSNRPPFLAQSPAPTNSFTLRYYYKTEPSFAWPGIPNPPTPGSIVPYLRPLTNGSEFVGNPASKDTTSLDIVYRPVWPERDPKDSTKPVARMPYGLTLALPQLGLPGIRDWKTAQVLYQQSIGANIISANPSVVLHDPTREKVSALAAQDLNALPPSVNAQIYQGKYYFPNLPPHLAQRVFYDPNRGAKGSLVLAGQFKDEQFGEDYFHLNVLRGDDLAKVMELCPTGDTDNYPKWSNLVAALATPMETFHENDAVPGTFIADTNLTVSVGVSDLAEVSGDSVAVDSYALSASGPGAGYVTLVEAGGRPFTQPGDPVALHIIRVVPELHRGELKVLPSANPLSEQVTFQHTPDLAGRFDEYFYEWKIAAPVDGQPPASDATMSRYQSLVSGTNHPMYLLSGAGIQVLGDNWLVLRYKPVNPSHPLYNQWSEWTRPQLAEGWIKRVLAGINPFNQRIRDLFNNRVNTDASILSQAGHRWEGDVALNLDTINNYGLIEIYETILRRGRSISIESGFNYGPANDALLLAAGYLNDLYMMIGNEAWADSANPTIGIGTADNTYGEIATALFAFKGQVPSLLEEELALLRGRDDFLVPGVEIAPVYNRMVWNYTRGIDAGEVIYALNYNIQENPDLAPDGVIDASDAAVMFPQGHGDACGHYLTALKGYYSLLLNNNFDWVPRSEAVLVLGQPVSVDYQDERKFAAAAAALARAGRQVFDLTWRKDYQAVKQSGWQHFAAARVNPQRQFNNAGTATNSVRHWGLDHWASRSAQGDFLNWVVGNAILPAVDPNPEHEGIQKIDRTTVPELQELVLAAEGLQNAMDGAEGGLTPVGLSENSIAFDLNPLSIANGPNTHFDQIFQRAKTALNNAVASFDDAKDVTRLMRSEQDSLADFQNGVAKQELAYENSLIELYGTPYTDDIGPGKTWKQGYAGPDLIHYMYVDLPEYDFPGLWNYMGSTTEFQIDIQDFPSDWADNYSLTNLNVVSWLSGDYTEGDHYLTINAGAHGFSDKPAHWTGRRVAPGRIQQAISQVIAAHTALRQSLFDQAGTKADLDRTIGLFEGRLAEHETIRDYQEDLLIAEQTLESVQAASDLIDKVFDSIKEDIVFTSDFSAEALPGSMIVGVSSGGDLTSAGRSAIEMAGYGIKKAFDVRQIVQFGVVKALEVATATSKRWVEFEDIAPLEWDQEVRSELANLGNDLEKVQALLAAINIRLREYDDATRAYRTLLAEGDRVQQERLIFRQRASAVVQGYRTRDAAFRIFRNEKLERYKTLFDLAARYSFLAANAYDYETGLLGNSAGRGFVNRIIGARALGVVRDGEPQFAGSSTGDPGLSSALAEMKADWEVVRGRLGFNNPDAYGTTVSLRTENFRILPTTNSDPTWRDILQQRRVPDLLADADVRRHCMQIGRGNGLPVPGIVIEFSTTIANGYNLFGQQLAAGDHAFSASSFATKIFGVGVALEGYRGMDDPVANGGAGGSSPADPDTSFLDPLALAATPYIYLIPVGVDSMRSPPFGDTSTIRTWAVDDIAIPLPFNIGASDFATGGMYLSGDSLTEPLFNIRKHQAFRPVSSASVFGSLVVYWTGGELARSQYTNTRLLGRSVWNSRWKLVIPGHTLLSDPNEGLDRLISTVRDVKIYFQSYSYSGN